MKMREIMEAVAAAPQQMTLPQIIRELVEEYKSRGIPATEIGSGWCEDFAHNALDRWIGDDWRCKDGHGQFDCVERNNFFKYNSDYDPIDWDWGLLKRHWNMTIPKGMTRRQMKELFTANHVWIATGGKHYDGEAPDGVQSFFELPFFKRWIEGVKNDPALK